MVRPGGLGAGQHRPKLFGVSWAWRGPGLGRRARLNLGASESAPVPGSHYGGDLEGPPAGGEGSLGLALQLLRSETVKVYVNNEINILVSFF